MFLKQSTSAVVLVGPVLDASGVAVTTAVIGDFTLTKNGTSAAMSGNTISHAHNGHYAITLTAANTDTIGRLTISVNNTAQAMPVFRWDICQPTVYDALFTNATNTTGGLPAATAAITALAGAVSTLTASGVRTELATELGRIDTTVSSRLATASYTAPLDATSTAAAVWNAALATYTTAGSFGARVVRTDSASAGNGLKVTGAGHGAADIHELQPAVITSAAFAADWLTAAGIAADAVTEIQLGLATAANLLIANDRIAYALTALVGACSDAQTAAETYTLSINGNTFTVDYAGLDASGNRGTTTLSKV